MGDMDREAGEAEIREAVSRAFGRAPVDSPAVTLFVDAGFEQADAVRGAKLMESGKFLNFEDAATTLLSGFRDESRELARRNPRASVARIAEVAARDASGSGNERPPLQEQPGADGSGRRL